MASAHVGHPVDRCIGAIALGSRWPKMMRIGPKPITPPGGGIVALGLHHHLGPHQPRVDDPVHHADMAMYILRRPGPSTAMMAITSTRNGMVTKMSSTRRNTASAQPPT